ncbi:MAG: hypothetical protein DI538_03505 [Azospira oryzae]|nr:MAG: hypothetical protein DI538_03505 [Azospira oryzae]
MKTFVIELTGILKLGQAFPNSVLLLRTNLRDASDKPVSVTEGYGCLFQHRKKKEFLMAISEGKPAKRTHLQ